MIKSPALAISLLSALIMVMCVPLHAAEKHGHSASHNENHSDALLFLLGHKIAIKKLQTQFSTISSKDQKVDNLTKQKTRLDHALPVLNEYMSRPESRYPNMQMYHESLKTRGAILADFSTLVTGYFQGASGL